MGYGCLTKHPLKTGCLEFQVDTKNDGLDNASLFKRGVILDIHVSFGGCILN